MKFTKPCPQCNNQISIELRSLKLIRDHVYKCDRCKQQSVIRIKKQYYFSNAVLILIISFIIYSPYLINLPNTFGLILLLTLILAYSVPLYFILSDLRKK